VNDRLVDAARAAQAQAYAPYSGYRVGAALETEDGRIFAGANVESAAYGVSLCAERAALGAAVAAGARRFRRLVVLTESTPAGSPCGACRQALAEFGLDLGVEAVGPNDSRRWQLGQLLPDSFGRGDLEA
jgi:cytidine deaminase